MNSATYVDQKIEEFKKAGLPIQEAVWETAKLCVGWPYVFGAEGQIAVKDGVTVRKFDCQGFTEWCLSQFGINIKAAGCTSQWNNDALWLAKGSIDSIPNDVLVCLFHRSDKEPKKMAHTGFGFRGATCECQVGVQFFAQRKSKWQYWAIPKGITDKVPEPDPYYRPTLRRGDKGEAVTLLQTELLRRGYDLGKYGADGDFGKATEAAVKAFQQDNGLTADGICGPKTWAALESGEIALYTVRIEHLSKTVANEITGKYGGIMTKE